MTEVPKWMDMGLSYQQALHGMQSAVAYRLNEGWDGASPKYLRVGINSAMLEHAALVALLMRKGLITREEYAEEVRLAANQELWTEEQRLKPLTFR